MTKYDQLIENEIKQLISKEFPDHGFLGEETGTENIDSDYVWIIDPIDGTKGFTRGLPDFSTLIALKHKNNFILGVSFSPVINQTLYAEKGGGTWLNGKKIRVSKIDTVKDALVLGPGYKYLAKTNTFNSIARLATDSAGSRNIGGFLSYHWLAAGHCEAMIEVDTFIYDVAPFICIIKEAGGKVTDLQGKPVTLETKAFVASNGILHEDILDYF